jgi:lauroyl/myristoyl acyltransferase
LQRIIELMESQEANVRTVLITSHVAFIDILSRAFADAGVSHLAIKPQDPPRLARAAIAAFNASSTCPQFTGLPRT